MFSLKQTPNILNIIYACNVAIFPLPVIMFFYQYKGATIGDFFLVQGIYALFVFLLEIPTGYMGDVFSRKKVLFFGFFAYVIGYALWFFGNGFEFLLSGELMFGVGSALMSGTLNAYLYDVLKSTNREKKFHKIYSRMELYGGVSMFVATLTGAFFYEFFGANSVAALSLFFSSISVVLLVFLPDVVESKRKLEQGKSKIQDILDISKYTIKHPEIKWIIFYSAIFSTCTLILMWGLQPIMIEAKIPVYMFSIVLSFNMLVRIFWSGSAGKVFDKINFNGIVKLLFIMTIMAFFAAVFVSDFKSYYAVYFGLFIIMLSSSSHSLLKVAQSTLINHRVTSDQRATVLSVSAMVGMLVKSFAMIMLKPLFDYMGVGNTFLICSILIIPLCFFTRKILNLNLKNNN